MKTKLHTHQPIPTALDALLKAPNPTDTALVRADVGPLPSPGVGALTPTPLASLPLTQAKRPRNGKIARLPKPVRDVVNRMLSLNIPQERIVHAMDELGIQVTQSNISNWKTRGGYREWCLAQEHATRLRLHQDTLVDLLRRHDAPELPEVGLQAAATQLSRFFLTPDALQLLASDPKEYERRVSMLGRISTQLKTLQHSRDGAAKALGPGHDPDRIRAETNGSLARLTNSYTSKIGESAKDPDIPHRNLLPKPADLFSFTDRAPDDSHKDDFLEFIERWSKRPSTPKPPSPDTPAAK